MLSSLRHLFARIQGPTAKEPARRPVVLAITPCYMEQLALRIASSRKHWDLLICPTLRGGLRTLRKRPVSVVVFDLDTRDTEWRTGIHLLVASANPVCVIALTGAFDDETWESALECGAYDLQSKPLKNNLRLADSVLAAHRLISSHELESRIETVENLPPFG